MRRNKKYLLRTMTAVALLCAGLASCSHDDLQDQGEQLPEGKYPLRLTATIGSPQTRAGGKDKWQGGEAIVVNIGDYTGKYIILDPDGYAAASGPSYYWQNSATATVFAWYPYAEGDRTYVISDQSQGYADFDFLYAETEGSYAKMLRPVFSHQMTKVSYTLFKGQGISDDDLSAATVTLLGDKSVTVSGGKITGTPTSQVDEIMPCHDAASLSGSAVMVPQDMTGKPLITVNVNGNDFIYTPDTEAAGNLQAGHQYTYTITVKANGIEVREGASGVWNVGGSEVVGGKELQNSYTASDLKFGDYYYSDGTWSDGGLRILYPDGTMKWAKTTPQPVSGKTVIGIVFYTGQHDSDHADYSATGIGQAKCHGYVVALTDVHNDENDRLRWECGPTQQFDQRVNASYSTADWRGYSNSLKIHEFVNKHTGWEMKHFPAAFACETYGKRTIDQDGNNANGKYDWQQPLAAPSNTSGWFLPSIGQLLHLYANRSLLSDRMTDVKNRTPADCIYRDKIKGLCTSSLHYWSSSEYSYNSYCAWLVYFGSGGNINCPKEGRSDVRAVLAF